MFKVKIRPHWEISINSEPPLEDPLMCQLLGILRQPGYHAIVNALPGYDAADTGKVFSLDASSGWCQV